MLTRGDGRGGELIGQSRKVQWAVTTAKAPRSVRLHPLYEAIIDFSRFIPICVDE
jgi:hypothetical protein